MEGLEHIRAIAWDFDGVLNANRVKGRFLWHAKLEDEFGVDASLFQQVMFRQNPRALACGQEDVLDRLERWADQVGFEGDVEDVLELWLREDLNPRQELLRMMEVLDRLGLTQIIATNNEPRRTRYIGQEAGFGTRVDAIFSSGEMGVMKPEPKFYETIETALGLEPREILLIDDIFANVVAAEKRGWLGWQFEDGGEMDLATALMPLLVAADSDTA